MVFVSVRWFFANVRERGGTEAAACRAGQASVLAVPGQTGIKTERQRGLAPIVKHLTSKVGGPCCAAVQKLSSNPQQWRRTRVGVKGRGFLIPL